MQWLGAAMVLYQMPKPFPEPRMTQFVDVYVNHSELKHFSLD